MHLVRSTEYDSLPSRHCVGRACQPAKVAPHRLQGQGSASASPLVRFRSHFFSLSLPLHTTALLDRLLPGVRSDKNCPESTDSGLLPAQLRARASAYPQSPLPGIFCRQWSTVFPQLTHPTSSSTVVAVNNTHRLPLLKRGLVPPFFFRSSTSFRLRLVSAPSPPCFPPVPLPSGQVPAAPSAGCRSDLAPSPFLPPFAANDSSRPPRPVPPISARGA